MSCALVLDPNGGIREIDLSEGDSLPAMYAAIGCHTVDVVRLTTQLDMWIDDDGLYTQPPNRVAAALARSYGRTSQAYHGPAVVAGVNGQGDTINLTEDQ